ncbi:hypothetical protein RvY_03163-2 [Ramazzottius varieornatus]|uniref:Uncharacterized protein n=1 Tax=Ramazzottius varieornatus TaxID=947166 RepID=A0A1D1UM41_RAMVA|nr:hypothetical protein RvY_03163-2 [Ramazzottius varieornatus]
MSSIKTFRTKPRVSPDGCTLERSRGEGDSRSGESQRLYTFGLVQNSKQIDARERKLIVYVADKHFAKLASARIKDNPRRPTRNAAVLPLLSLKNVDNRIFGLLMVFGLKPLSSRPYPLTNAWTELAQSFFEYTLSPSVSPFPFELKRETLITNSMILLPENASPTSSYIKSTLEILHKHPTFLDESKVLDEQIEKVRKQLATGLTAADVPVKSSAEVLTAELERFMKTRSDLLPSAVSRALTSKEKLAKDLDVYVKDNIHAKNVLLAPLSFFLEDNQQAHINYGMLPPLDGIFVYDAGRYTELDLLLALTRFPSADTSAPKVVLIGDHMSLPLDSDGQELSAGPLSSSLLHRYFKRYGLLTDNVSLALKVQHHTDQEIFRYANTAFYSNILSDNT